MDSLVLQLIQKYRSIVDGGAPWYGVAFSEATAILALKKATKTQLADLFYQSYDDKGKAVYRLAQLFMHIKAWQQVVEILEIEAPSQPLNYRLWGSLGTALRIIGRVDEAIKILESINIPEDKPSLIAQNWGRLGTTYGRKGDLEQAEYYLKQALDRQPSAWMYNNLCFILREKGDIDGAIAQCQKAITLNPHHPRPHCSLAQIYLQVLHQPEQAISEYETAITLGVHDVFVLYELATALEAAGRTTEARQRYQEYLDRDPWGEHAPEALAALERLGA